MKSNPYESPQTSSEPDLPKGGAWSATENNVRVDGKLLVVRSGVILPRYCVKTNEPITELDMTRKTLTWCSPLVAFLFLLALIVYFVVRKKCVITYGISPEIKQKYRKRLFVKASVAVSLLLVLIFAISFDLFPLFLVVFSPFLISLLVLVFGNSPLTVSMHKDGYFWIKGCSKEFLASLSE